MLIALKWSNCAGASVVYRSTGSMKSGAANHREKDLFTLVPSQISPNPLRRRTDMLTSPLSESSQPSTTTTTTTTTTGTTNYCSEPVLNFENLLEKRHGSVLGHEIILKSEHFFKGNNGSYSYLLYPRDSFIFIFIFLYCT